MIAQNIGIISIIRKLAQLGFVIHVTKKICCSDEETIQHTKLGNCIAMEIRSEGELPLLFVGRVESMYNTDATRLEPGDAP